MVDAPVASGAQYRWVSRGLTNGPGTPFGSVFIAGGGGPATPCLPTGASSASGHQIRAGVFTGPIYLRLRVWLYASRAEFDADGDLISRRRPPDYEADESLGWRVVQ
jgi:hypothetical protein